MHLSIIVIFHDMRREAARTLLSLSSGYQQGVDPDTYEVIAIDNGSAAPLNPEDVAGHGPNFRYFFHDTGSISPVGAMNFGASIARGTHIAFIVDGARMATPGLLRKTLDALRLHPLSFVFAPAWHLGPDIQNRSMLEGYDQHREDALLASIEWPDRGYDLFDISTIAPSSGRGFLGGVPPECSWLALPRAVFDALGGYESRFESGGGGLVNHHFRNRVAGHPGIRPVALLGEGVFHQFHGGIATNVALEHHPITDFRVEYEAICGQPYTETPAPEVSYYGSLPRQARRFVFTD